MIQYMKHPLHGKMPVYTDAEVIYNQKSGWILEKTIPSESPAPAKREDVSETSPPIEKENGENTCPKCGKSFQRGLTMHMKFCKGID